MLKMSGPSTDQIQVHPSLAESAVLILACDSGLEELKGLPDSREVCILTRLRKQLTDTPRPLSMSPTEFLLMYVLLHRMAAGIGFEWLTQSGIKDRVRSMLETAWSEYRGGNRGVSLPEYDEPNLAGASNIRIPDSERRDTLVPCIEEVTLP